MWARRSGVALALLVAGAAVAVSGCTRTFVFRHDNLPNVSRGVIVVPEEPGEAPEPWPLESVVLLDRTRGRVVPTQDEWQAFTEGRLAGVDGAELVVSNQRHVLRNHVLAGGLIGLAFGAGIASIVIASGGADEVEAGLGFTATAAVQGTLIGWAVGSAVMSGREDRRLDRPAAVAP